MQHHTPPTTIAKARSSATVNVYLILKQDESILLGLRQNTGYCDGMYGLVAGHVEAGETATEALVRETREEAGIEVAPEHLKVVHVMHRQTNRFNIDIFFMCDTWRGEITNNEPHKCGELSFYPLQQLPETLMEYMRSALTAVQQGKCYSEFGWQAAF